MSAHQEFFEAQRLLNTLFYTGHRTSRANVDYLLSQINQHVNNMVSYNTNGITNITPPQPPTRVLNGPMTAPLRAAPASRSSVSRYNPLEKSKVIPKKKLEDPCPTECAICQDTPKHKDAVCTECNHYYCKACWQSWMNAERSNKKCPTCRKDMPRITSFKARTTKPLTGPMTAPLRPVRLMVIDDDDDNDISHMASTIDDF